MYVFNLKNAAPAFQLLDHGATLKIERKVSHLNIAFDRYVSIGNVMHYILVINVCGMCRTVCFALILSKRYGT